MKHDAGFLKLRKIRAAQQIAKTISESTNRVFLPANTLMLNIADDEYLTSIDNKIRKR